MADISTFEEGKNAYQAGGFCWYNLKWAIQRRAKQNGPDMKLIKQLVQENICVIAEGKFIPEQARQIKSWVLQELSLVVQLHDHKKLLKDLSMH